MIIRGNYIGPHVGWGVNKGLYICKCFKLFVFYKQLHKLKPSYIFSVTDILQKI